MPDDLPRDPAQAARERQALIVGRPPRFEPLAVEAYPADARRLAGGEREARGEPPRDPDDLRPLSEHAATLLRHPDLYRTNMAFGLQLLSHGTLAPRDREMAILRTGWLCQAPFEWGEHVEIAKRVGLTSEAIERITVGSAAPGWSEHEQAILRAVEQLHDQAMISDEVWATLARRLDEKQLIELPFLVGHYHMVAFYQNTLRLRLREANQGLLSR